jgi:hypothetical protein
MNRNKPKFKLDSRLQWVLENGPVIVTVLGSILIALLASVVSFTTVQLLQAILALLALIGTSLLTDRLMDGRQLKNRLETIDNYMREMLEYARNAEAVKLNNLIIERRELKPLEDRFYDATRIYILGGSLFRLANEYKSLFEKLARKGCKLRFLLTDPESDAPLQLSSTVAYEAVNHDAYQSQMEASLTSIMQLAKDYPNICELRLYKFAPSFSIVLVEKNSGESFIQVEIYAFRVPARNRLTLMLDQKKEPKLYEFFSHQFDAIWNSEFSRTISAPHKQP